MENLYLQLLRSRKKMGHEASDGAAQVKASTINAPVSLVFCDIARDLGLSEEQAIAIAGHREQDEVVMVPVSLIVETRS
jgi:hypothetical protein